MTTASMSQLMRPVSSSAGEAAKAAASHGRRGLTPASSHADSSAIAAKPRALTMTNPRISFCTWAVPARSPAGWSARACTSPAPVAFWVTHAAPYAK